MRSLSFTFFVLTVAVLAYAATARGNSTSFPKYNRRRAVAACKALSGKVKKNFVENTQYTDAPTGLSYDFCFLKVYGANSTGIEDYTSVIIGLESMDPLVPTIAATFVKTSPPIDWKKIDGPSDPAGPICDAYGGSESFWNALGLGFTERKGQYDMCVFGDGSRASAFSLAYISSSGEVGFENFAYIRSAITDAQVYTNVNPRIMTDFLPAN